MLEEDLATVAIAATREEDAKAADEAVQQQEIP